MSSCAPARLWSVWLTTFLLPSSCRGTSAQTSALHRAPEPSSGAGGGGSGRGRVAHTGEGTGEVVFVLCCFCSTCLSLVPFVQVQQSVHNSFFNTTSFDPTYAALKGITSSKGADGMIYGALASQVYGSVADQVYQDITNHDTAAQVEEVEAPAGPDPTVLFEAARAKFFQEGQKVFSKRPRVKVFSGRQRGRL